MTTSDPVGTAVASIGAGATSGAVLMTAGVFLLRLLQSGDPSSVSPDFGGAILSTAVSTGLLVAVAVAWLRSRRIDDVWRRGVTAAVAVFGTVILSVLAAPIDSVAGTRGLGAYLAVLVGAAIASHRAAGRAARA
ncbi:MAG: hypothetical protein IH616_08410 [Gemmatimonadales bacterium]|nr:hypothetical protein [Gemmatimonadales bacterium]